jgi:hypothetical protein
MSNLLSSDKPSLWTLGALLVRGLAAAVFLSPFAPNDGRKRDRTPPSAFAPLFVAGADPGLAGAAAPPRFKNERLASPLLDELLELPLEGVPGFAPYELDGVLLPGLLPKADEDDPLEGVGFLSSPPRPGSLLVKPPRREPIPPPDELLPLAGFAPDDDTGLSLPLPKGRRDVTELRPPDFWSPPLGVAGLSPPPVNREPKPPRTPPPEAGLLSPGFEPLDPPEGLLPDPPKRDPEAPLAPDDGLLPDCPDVPGRLPKLPLDPLVPPDELLPDDPGVAGRCPKLLPDCPLEPELDGLPDCPGRAPPDGLLPDPGVAGRCPKLLPDCPD